MQWKGGGPLAIAQTLKAQDTRTREAAHAMMQEVVSEAQRRQREIIERAETETGRRRAASGRGVAGRIETGLMFNGTSASATWDSEHSIVGKWGWQDPEPYFRYQDQGTRSIAPALSLLTSFLAARSEFTRRLRSIARKGS